MVELVPKVVEWIRQYLRDLNGALLDDPRVNVLEADAVEKIFKGESHSYEHSFSTSTTGLRALVKAISPIRSTRNEEPAGYAQGRLKAEAEPHIDRQGRTEFQSTPGSRRLPRGRHRRRSPRASEACGKHVYLAYGSAASANECSS